jgi:hypothetical protein
MKIGLDDYLLDHEIADLEQLPKVEVVPDEKKQTLAERLIEIGSQYTLFHDDTQEGYAWIENKALPVRSSRFKQFLSYQLWQTEGKAVTSEALSQAMNVLEGMAVFEGRKIKLHNRVASYEGAFFYDLCDGRVVRITPEGWTIVSSQVPILFKSYSHQQHQVLPATGGSLDMVLPYMNISKAADAILVLVYLVSCFVPNIPHPILYPHNEHGGGKTTLVRVLKALIDPSKIDTLSPHRTAEEIVQVLEHHHFVAFDNLSGLPDWLSDILCQAVTGGGFSKRKLYSDNDDIIYSFMRCISLNGISVLIHKADLMDRTILIPLERIPKNRRREQNVVMAEFQEQRPFISGAIFDALSKAMRVYPTLSLGFLERMADFMRWGCAIAEALGHRHEDFIDAYQRNIQAQNNEIVSTNTLAQAILQFMSGKDWWEGTVQEAYEEFKQLIAVEKTDRTFPGHSNKMRKHLERIKPNLAEYGITFIIADFHHEKGVPLTIHRIPPGPSGPSASSDRSNQEALETEDALKVSEDSGDAFSNSLMRTVNYFSGDERSEDREDQTTPHSAIAEGYSCGDRPTPYGRCQSFKMKLYPGALYLEPFCLKRGTWCHTVSARELMKQGSPEGEQLRWEQGS